MLQTHYASQQGTLADLEECLGELSDFVKALGGPHSQSQWEADGLQDYSMRPRFWLLDLKVCDYSYTSTDTVL